ncbi:hypothetical protein QTL95_05300 [Rhizobium sp. S152]|uniref:hypothetical protein n=1 Tax=Rhizobium sp. S152 TaxID=3055038 RepID=UPI0025A9B16C|nr:hypothetical protein [Rhizobium sp. S152]MDM9625298.1 hypothetical protein [Rhizobium sp. S152]
MSSLIIAAAAYIVLALSLVVAIDNLVALYFRDKRTPMDLRVPLGRMIAVSRRYYLRR